MSDSLRDQLLKAGLVTKKQAAQSERQQFRGSKGRKTSPATVQAPAGDPAQATKVARDRDLNRAQQAKIEARSRRAQLRQVIDQHRISSPESEEYFNFVDGGKVRRIAVDGGLRARLVAGSLLIVRCDGRYSMVPVDAAALICERDPVALVRLESSSDPNAAAGAEVEDDPYRNFTVPDDLTW